MGFTVHLLYPGVPVSVGDLEFFPVTADQVSHGIIEEWDVLPYLVHDRQGDGSLFTNVDMAPTDSMWREARTRIERPCLWAHTNNSNAWHFTYSWVKADPGSVRNLVDQVVNCHTMVSRGWPAPEASLIIGGGFAFGGDRAWLNGNVFLIDHFKVDSVLSALLPGHRFLTPRPGQTLVMKGGRLEGVEPTPFVAALPESQWPSKTFEGNLEWIERYDPACGVTDLPESELDALQEGLDGFARHLYAHQPFRRLYSLTHDELKGRKPTFALVLRADGQGGAYVYEYTPQACAFVPVDSHDPPSDYLAVYECWATDLLAFLRCEISSTALTFGHSRAWNANPEAFSFGLNHPLFEYVHPLRMPDRALRFYRRLLAAQPAPGVVIPAAG